MVRFSQFITFNEMFSLKMRNSSSRPDIYPQHFPTQDERERNCFFWWSQKLKEREIVFWWLQKLEEREIVGLVVAKIAKMHFKLQSLIGSKLANVSWITSKKEFTEESKSSVQVLQISAEAQHPNVYGVSQKNALSECCWSHSALAQSPFARIRCVWRLIFWSLLTKTKRDQAPPSHVIGKI